MAVYNEEEHLQEVLPLYAKYFNEIIFVHDGPCSDRSVEIAQECGAQIIELPYRHQEAVYLRQLGMDTATGDWIIISDPDERIPEALLETMHHKAQDRDRLGFDVILLKRITYETRPGVPNRFVADQNLPRFFKNVDYITWPPVPHVEIQGFKKASRLITGCARCRALDVLHFNSAESFPERHARYIRVAKYEWPKLKGTEWEAHMRNLFAAWGIPEEEYDECNNS